MASTLNLGLDDALFDTHQEPLGKHESNTYFQGKQSVNNFEESERLGLQHQHYQPLKKQMDNDFSRQSHLAPAQQEHSSHGGLIQAPTKENDASLAPPFK